MIKIGFDFSLNKPAVCLQKNNKYYFFIWPLELDDKSVSKLNNADINVFNRNRIKEGKNSSEKIRVHITMANNLSNLIIHTLKQYIDDNVIIAFEGASFASKGNISQELTAYRFILVNELAKIYGLENIFTYAPQTIKSIAGCATKDKKGKGAMINAFTNEDLDHKFNLVLKNSPELLKKKTNFILGIDDLTDAYFTLKTLQIKENLPLELPLARVS